MVHHIVAGAIRDQKPQGNQQQQHQNPGPGPSQVSRGSDGGGGNPYERQPRTGPATPGQRRAHAPERRCEKAGWNRQAQQRALPSVERPLRPWTEESDQQIPCGQPNQCHKKQSGQNAEQKMLAPEIIAHGKKQDHARQQARSDGVSNTTTDTDRALVSGEGESVFGLTTHGGILPQGDPSSQQAVFRDSWTVVVGSPNQEPQLGAPPGRAAAVTCNPAIAGMQLANFRNADLYPSFASRSRGIGCNLGQMFPHHNLAQLSADPAN